MADKDLTVQFAAEQAPTAKQQRELLEAHLRSHVDEENWNDQAFVALIEECADQGNLFAARVLAQLACNLGVDWDLDWKLRDTRPFKNPVQAFDWARVAAQSGSGWDLDFLADCYLHGEGVERDPKRALELKLQAVAAWTVRNPEFDVRGFMGEDLVACASAAAAPLLNGVTIQPVTTPTPQRVVGNAPAQA